MYLPLMCILQANKAEKASTQEKNPHSQLGSCNILKYVEDSLAMVEQAGELQATMMMVKKTSQ